MRIDLTKVFRVGRWVLLLPWICAMDDGCAALDAIHEGRVAAARSSVGRTVAPVSDLPFGQGQGS